MNDLLYHYCSTETFTSIVTRHELWLSSLSLSNDSLEGKLLTQKLLEMAGRNPDLRMDLSALEAMLEGLLVQLDGLGLCLSRVGDLLSQWRGYADDGHGVSLGFHRESLQSIGDEDHPLFAGTRFSVVSVEYDATTQEKLLVPVYDAIVKSIAAGAFLNRAGTLLGGKPSPEEISNAEVAAMRLAHSIIGGGTEHRFAFKNSAFREEQEVRLLTHLVLHGRHEECSYRAGRGRMVAYKSVKLAAPSANLLREVILGPKHLTPPEIVKAYLLDLGFTGVEVRRSEASYR